VGIETEFLINFASFSPTSRFLMKVVYHLDSSVQSSAFTPPQKYISLPHL